MRVCVFDPAGNHGNEGFGVTGWALFKDDELLNFSRIEAKDYQSQEDYWQAHKVVIVNSEPDIVVIESYKLQASKSKQQINSTLDTPQLIGFMRMVCFYLKIPVVFQNPQDKVRVSDEILVKEGVFELRGKKHYCMGRQTADHERDSIRHGIFFLRYRIDKVR